MRLKKSIFLPPLTNDGLDSSDDESFTKAFALPSTKKPTTHLVKKVLPRVKAGAKKPSVKVAVFRRSKPSQLVPRNHLTRNRNKQQKKRSHQSSLNCLILNLIAKRNLIAYPLTHHQLPLPHRCHQKMRFPLWPSYQVRRHRPKMNLVIP